jgi:hypothetical protein
MAYAFKRRDDEGYMRMAGETPAGTYMEVEQMDGQRNRQDIIPGGAGYLPQAFEQSETRPARYMTGVAPGAFPADKPIRPGEAVIDVTGSRFDPAARRGSGRIMQDLDGDGIPDGADVTVTRRSSASDGGESTVVSKFVKQGQQGGGGSAGMMTGGQAGKQGQQGGGGPDGADVTVTPRNSTSDGGESKVVPKFVGRAGFVQSILDDSAPLPERRTVDPMDKWERIRTFDYRTRGRENTEENRTAARFMREREATQARYDNEYDQALARRAEVGKAALVPDSGAGFASTNDGRVIYNRQNGEVIWQRPPELAGQPDPYKGPMVRNKAGFLGYWDAENKRYTWKAPPAEGSVEQSGTGPTAIVRRSGGVPVNTDTLPLFEDEGPAQQPGGDEVAAAPGAGITPEQARAEIEARRKRMDAYSTAVMTR